MSGDHDRPPAPSLAAVPFRLAGISSRLAPLGPRHGVDDKPGLHDLQYMSYTGEDGRDVHFRLMDQLKPHWRRLAIGLKFPQNEIAIMENKDDPVYYLFSEWLRGANQEKDPRPVTWRTLIEALQHANVQEEATILKKHFIQVPVIIPNAAAAAVVKSDEGMSTSSLSSSATTAITASELIHSPPSQPAELSSDATAEIETNRKVVEELRDLVSDYSLMLTEFKRLLSGCDVSDARFYLKNMLSTDDFTSCDNIEKLLNRLCHCYVDTFNVYYLQKLAICFKRDDASKLVEQYNKKKDKFLKETTVLNFHEAIKSKVNDLPKRMVKITIKIPRELATNRILKDMEELAVKAFGDKYNQLVHFHVIAGSVVICWFVVESLCEVLQQLAREKVAVWRQHGVEKVMVGSQCVYSSSSKKEVFNDPILGQLAFAPVVFKIINTRQFQRLRDIKQLGPVYYLYPGAAHNRFEHSIGVCHLAGQLLKNLRQEQEELFEEYGIREKDEMCVLIAALCHELGQGPMSHLYQDLFIRNHYRKRRDPEWKHLETGIKMFDYLVAENIDKLRSDFEDMEIDPDPNSADMMFIKELIYGGILPNEQELKGRPLNSHWFLYEIVSNSESGIDVDKMDYIIRDCHGLGIQHGFDWQRYMRLCWLIKADDDRVHICSREKQAADFYELYHVRDKLMREAYQHKTKRAIEHMMSEALKEADAHIELPGKDGRKVKISEAIDDVCAFTHLTDGVFWYIKFSREPGLTKARSILEKVDRRELYKCIGQTIIHPKRSEIPLTEIPGELIKLLDIRQMECEVNKDDLLVDVIAFNYGKGAENPIDKVWFYRKPEPTEAVRVHRHQVSEMLPKSFEEFEMRLYVKKQVTDEMRERLFSAFVELCRCNGFQTPAGARDPGTDPL